MPFSETSLPGVIIFEPVVLSLMKADFFLNLIITELFQSTIIFLNEFVQDNQSFSVYGVIRGLHYQREPHTQSKLVRVIAW